MYTIFYKNVRGLRSKFPEGGLNVIQFKADSLLYLKPVPMPQAD